MLTGPGVYIRKTSCGYCHGKDSSYIYGLDMQEMSAVEYQQLIERGYRRSGSFVYKPDLRHSCCPQYTIRLPVAKFKPGKEQRQTLNRFNRGVMGAMSSKKHGKNNQFDLVQQVRLPEEAGILQIRLESADFTKEKYELFKLYQESVHQDDDVSERGFNNFLCTTSVFQDHSETNKVACHQTYRLSDGRLIAFAVLDILCDAVSSVYFVWHPEYAHYGMGKIAALREIALTKTLGKQYYLMGYYIHSCVKMRYKGKYHPSELLDPRFTELDPNYHWRSIEEFAMRLDESKYVTFCTEPESDDSQNGDRDDESIFRKASLFKAGMPGMLTPAQVEMFDTNKVPILVKVMGRELCIPQGKINPEIASGVRLEIDELTAAVGEMMLDSILDFSEM